MKDQAQHMVGFLVYNPDRVTFSTGSFMTPAKWSLSHDKIK
jgi:hypothetical protein